MRPRADLALLATAELVTQFGAMLTVLAIALHLQPSGPGWVAAAMVAELAPMALLALVAGAVVDRLPNRPVMVAAYVTQAVAVAMMSIVMDAEWLVLVLLAVVGGAASAARPAALSLARHAVAEK